MKIKLLLNKLTQDQSASNRDELAFVGWAHGPSAGADKDKNVSSKLPFLSLRKEDWGGVVVHGPSLSVFQVDEAAYNLLERLKYGESLLEIKQNPKGVNIDEIDEFINLIKHYNIDEKQ